MALRQVSIEHAARMPPRAIIDHPLYPRLHQTLRNTREDARWLLPTSPCPAKTGLPGSRAVSLLPSDVVGGVRTRTSHKLPGQSTTRGLARRLFPRTFPRARRQDFANPP